MAYPMEQIVYIPRIDSRGALAALKNEPTLCAGTHVVYVYFLAGDLIPYPKGQSNIIYVGEAMRDSEPTGVRFRQHVTPTAVIGADMGNNFTVSQYFHAGMGIGLSVFRTGDDRISRERDLIYAHIALYGAPPIGQGKIPNALSGKNRTTHIFNYMDANLQALTEASAVLSGIVSQVSEASITGLL